MVMAPSATCSCWRTGEILDPQLSEPTHKKCPVRLFRFAASRIRLPAWWAINARDMKDLRFYGKKEKKEGVYSQCFLQINKSNSIKFERQDTNVVVSRGWTKNMNEKTTIQALCTWSALCIQGWRTLFLYYLSFGYIW